MSIHCYDVIVLGAGPGGEAAAGMVADAGLKTAVVEQHLIGGECSFYACMPSKALLRPSTLFGEIERTPGLNGIDGISISPERVLARRDQVIQGLDDSSQLPWLESHEVALHRGHGVIAGDREIRVGEDVLVADRAVIVATGSGAAIPPIEGLERIELWNNRQGTTADHVPAKLLILGGGPVGCELAQAWSSLGSDVTLIEMAPRLLSKEEPFVGEQVAAALRDRFGVEVITDAKVTGADSGDENGGSPRLELADGRILSGTELLIATGRMPRTDLIGLEAIDLEGEGWIETDEQMRVPGHPWLYAIGDVNGRALLTHAAKYQGWIAARSILGKPLPPLAEQAGFPRVTFTDPQVAAVGLTLDQALEQGVDAVALDVPTKGTPGASFEGRGTEGTCRLVVDAGSGTIRGATFSGYGVSEWIHAATVAITTGATLDRLRHAVPVFPTRSEIWLRLQEQWEQL